MLSMLVLGIETSCDDTSLALVEDGILLDCMTKSQISLHEKYGGIIPELASREHQKIISELFIRLLDNNKKKPEQITHIGATHGPGLMGSLLVGAQFARGLSIAINAKHYPINHLEGHIFSCMIDMEELPAFPWIVLLVSGGHTSLIYSEKPFEYNILGNTLDDAVGECFDKIARYLGLGYPGGPIIEEYAAIGEEVYDLPKSFYKDDTFRFSYSGLKTATCLLAEKEQFDKDEKKMHNLCASFQKSAFLPLIKKLGLAIDKYNPNSIFLSGGVSANTFLRNKVNELAKKKKVALYLPKKGMSMDNAAMIAQATYFKAKYNTGETGYDIKINPSWRIGN